MTRSMRSVALHDASVTLQSCLQPQSFQSSQTHQQIPLPCCRSREQRLCGGFRRPQCRGPPWSDSAAASGACPRACACCTMYKHAGIAVEMTSADSRLLQARSCTCRASQPAADGGPYLHSLAAGGGLALAPPPRRRRAPEAEARLAQLQRRLDEKQYADMVADITVEVSCNAKNPFDFATAMF